MDISLCFSCYFAFSTKNGLHFCKMSTSKFYSFLYIRNVYFNNTPPLWICSTNYNVPIVMDSLVGSIESDMGIKAT